MGGAAERAAGILPAESRPSVALSNVLQAVGGFCRRDAGSTLPSHEETPRPAESSVILPTTPVLWLGRTF